MDVSGIAGAGKSHLLKQVAAAASFWGQKRRYPFSDGRQRKGPTQNGIACANVSGIPTQAGARGDASD